MSKHATMIMRPRYPYRKEINKYYEAQFLTGSVLNDEIKKKSIKKRHKKQLEYARVNPLRIVLGS
jgi:hypothetical protein